MGPMARPFRAGITPGFILGTSGEATGAGDVDDVNCAYGFEGNKRVIPAEEDPDRAGDEVFMTCHFTIKVPEWWEEYSITLIVFGTLLAIGWALAITIIDNGSNACG